MRSVLFLLFALSTTASAAPSSLRNLQGNSDNSNANEDNCPADSAKVDDNGCYTGKAAAVTCACSKYDANCCVGEFACEWPSQAEVTVCPDSCNGSKACMMDKISVIAVGVGSCNGLQACHDIGQGEDFSDNDKEGCDDGACDKEIGDASCNGAMSCSRSQGEVGNGSCNGLSSCYLAEAEIGHNSCTDDNSCTGAEEAIGDNRRRL